MYFLRSLFIDNNTGNESVNGTLQHVSTYVCTVSHACFRGYQVTINDRLGAVTMEVVTLFPVTLVDIRIVWESVFSLGTITPGACLCLCVWGFGSQCKVCPYILLQ